VTDLPDDLVTEWVRVEDRMPKDDWLGLIVLEATPANTAFIGRRDVRQGTWDGPRVGWREADGGKAENRFWRVSHWRDFPQAPAS
jgi:hypothetical protein